tara:strand:- start:1551 stop:2033 length:483 start_codon:yes stop_codon:yes gene_type:complete
MLINLKNNLHWLLFAVFSVVYFVLFFKGLFTWSVVWLLFSIYTWLIVSLVLHQYKFKQFLYLLCISGIWVSLTWFFVKGVEEVPLPQGAFLFKPEGIVTSIVLFIFFTAPLIIYSFTDRKKAHAQYLEETIEEQKTSNKDASDWEEASIEDLESGKYEII